MPRPPKKRFVCCMPQNEGFSPSADTDDTVTMTVDEYETIRLIDLEDYTQEDCAAQMHIARTTVQGVYNTARRKLADALVNGKRLIISGGDYKLCECYGKQCGRGCREHCHKHSCGAECSEKQE